MMRISDCLKADVLYRISAALWAPALLAAICSGQNASVPAQAIAPKISHGAFPVAVIKTLDSSKLKEDDTVELETAGSFKLADGTVVPKGSELDGRVVSAKARANGDPNSELRLAFNRLILQGGKQLSIKGVVQAIIPPADKPMGPNMATMGTSSGGAMKGAGGDATGITNAQIGSNMESPSKPQAEPDMKATGVQGIHDLQLENGVITSKGKNVKLGNGVRVIVKAEISE